MKKLLLSFLLCFPLLVTELYAQMEIVGSSEYGRIFDINYDPLVENKLYAVTLGNHILQSTDNGVTWQILYSYPETNVSIKSLRMLPGNQASFYITYGEVDKIIILDLASLEVLREYVLPKPADSEKEWISAYSLWKNNPDTAMVLQGFKIGFANFAKVYYTTDGGKTWDEIYYNVDYNEVFPNNVAISASDPQKLFIMRGMGPTDVDGGLFVSNDAGATWNEMLQGNALFAISFNPANPDEVLLGTFIQNEDQDENLYRSTDGGDTWDIIPVNWTDQIQDNINAIVYNPLDPNNIIILEENEMVITHDNFATHEIFVYPDFDTYTYYYGLTASFNPFNVNEVFVNGDYYPFFSTNGGETLTRVLNPYFVTTGNVDISDTDEAHLYYSVQYGYVHRDLSTGIDTPYGVMPLDYMTISGTSPVIADPLLAGRVYTYQSSFMGNDLKVSNDHGNTTFPVLNGFSPTLHTVVSDPANPDIIWASLSYYGETPEVYKIDFTDQSNVQSVLITLPYQDMVTGIYIDRANSLNITMAVGTKVFKSADGGNTWVESTGLDELVAYQDLIMKLANNPINEQQLTIATNKGIFTSMDAGATWTKILDGLFHNVVHSTDVDGHIVAVTNVSQISESSFAFTNDNGLTWAQVSNAGLMYLQATTSAVKFDGQMADIYLGTDDIGLVKYTVDINTVGTTNVPVTNEISVYPNPTTRNLTISGIEIGTPVAIFDLSGRLLMTINNQPLLDLSDLETGAYILKSTGQNGKSVHAKFIKR